MKRFIYISLLLGFSAMGFSNPYPNPNFICIENPTPFNLQVYLNRTPVTVAPRYVTPINTMNPGQILAQMNTRQLVNRRPGWTDLVLFPNNFSCNQDNTVSIGITAKNVLFFQ